MRPRPGRLAFSIVFALMASQGCAAGPKPLPLNQPAHASLNGNDASQGGECADRIDGARAGGLAGSVFGTIIGTVFGMPYLGLAYKLAGYAIGFTAGNSCANVKPTEDGSEPAELGVRQAGAKTIAPASRRPIKEENL
jgi:hypothetical protein